MNYYTVTQVKKSSDKGRKGTWISDYLLWRPVSVYVTWLFANLRLSSVFTVWLSIVCIVSAAILLFNGDKLFLIVAAIGIEVYALLDHVDGELARFEINFLGKKNSRVGHYLDLLAHKFSVIAMFAIGWEVAHTTGNEWYTVMSFMLCFFILGPSNEPANQVVIEEAKKTDMSDALSKLRAFNPSGSKNEASARPSSFLIFFNELFGFPGWLHLIVAACLLDAFASPLIVLGDEYAYREALIIMLTPIYVAKFVYALRWYLKIMLSIRHG